MASLEDIRARIDHIDAILQTGANSVAIDGLTVSYNFDELRRERKELEKKLPGCNNRRPTHFLNRLG